MIAGSALISILITLVIAGVMFWIAIWFINWIGLPEPFNKVARVIIGLAALIFLASILVGGTGHPLLRF